MALSHREPDRVPLDYGAKLPVTERLCQYLGVDPACEYSCYGEYPEALLQRLHVDIRTVRARYIGPPLEIGADGSQADVLGVRSSTDGYPLTHPLAHVTSVREIEAYRFPDPDAFDYEHYAEQCARFEDYAVCGGDWCPIFTYAMELMGTEAFLVAFHTMPEVVHALLERLTSYYCETSGRMFDAAHGKLDIFYTGDDYGTQVAPFISPRHFREFILPRLKRLYDLAKSHGLYVMQHSCGSVRAFIPDLISIGLDVLDPVQVRAAGMDIVGLKRDFGSQITLHGSIDTQRTLPFGTTEDVRNEVLQRLRDVAPGGGLILCGSQEYTIDIAPENIVTIYDTACEVGQRA
ncbi:MAG: hypothetical protein GX601_04715 [Anaerolineales bacterium]|nr:hypothetical protein [Anaerolineales bacterium]